MEEPPKTLATIGYSLGASAYFGMGVLGSVVDIPSRFVPGLSLLSALLAAAGVPLCARGIARFRAVRERIPERGAIPEIAQPAN